MTNKIKEEEKEEKRKDIDIASRERPEVGFKAIQVTSGKYRVIDSRGLFVSEEIEKSEAYKLSFELNLRSPEVKYKNRKENTGIWNENYLF